MADSTVNGYLVALADAMASALNGAQVVTLPAVSPFATAFSAERAHAPVTDLTEIKDKNPDGSPAAPFVQILPHSDETQAEGLSQRQVLGTLSVSVIVYGRVGARTAENKVAYEAKCAALSLLRDQIRSYFLTRKVSVVSLKTTWALLKKTEGEPAMFIDDLVGKQVFVSEQVYRFHAVM
jgi:hypothetical protein